MYTSFIPKHLSSSLGLPGIDEMDIRFTMDLESENVPPTGSKQYENEKVNKNTSYDIPKPIATIVMSDLQLKDELR